MSTKPPAERALATALKKAAEAADDRIVRFAVTTLGEEWVLEAIEEYLDVDIEDLDRAELSLAIPAIMHFIPVNLDAPTAAQLWSRRKPKEVTRGGAKYLLAFEMAWLSIWKVVRIEPGVGSELIDALTGRTAFVHDVETTKSFRVHDALLAVVVDCDGVQFFGAMYPRGLDARDSGLAIDEARRICRVRTRPVAPDKLRDIDHQLAIVSMWKELVANALNRAMPELRNMDGDLMIPTTDDFAIVADRAEVLRMLGEFPGATLEREANEDVVVIMKPINVGQDDSEIVTGRILVTDKALRAETNSTRRADELRGEIEKRLGARVRHRLREETDLVREIDAIRAKGGAATTKEPKRNPEALAVMREMRARYMREWLDESIPMLDGLTPRAAAKDPRMKKKIARLIEEVEQSEAMHPQEERIDVSFIRAELKLT